MLRIRIEAQEAITGLERTKGQLQNSLFTALVKSTALTRETVIDNIKTGMKKNLGWPPFSPYTIARKSKRGRSLYGLIDTGRMMTSIHESISKTKMEGEVYPGVEYLKFHELGTRKMRARKTFEPVPREINKKVEEIFKSEIAGALTHGL